MSINPFFAAYIGGCIVAAVWALADFAYAEVKTVELNAYLVIGWPMALPIVLLGAIQNILRRRRQAKKPEPVPARYGI